MPRLKSETFGAGYQSWLGSAHGLRNARTVTIDISAFTSGTHYPDGYIPSGTPVAIVSNLAVPYDKTEGTTTGASVLAGFILTDQPVVGTRSEEHTSELQSLMRISYAVFCLK